MMNIAILLSTYNGATFIRKQLDSIANQTIADRIRLYVRDDGSSDGTLEILNEYKSRIDMTIICGDNVGPAKSFWELFTDSSIKADYYAFCDQDDIWDATKLETGIKDLESHKDKQLWCSNCRVIDSEDVVTEDRYHRETPYLTIPSQFVCGSIQGCAMIFNDDFRNRIISDNVKRILMHDFVLITYAIANDVLIYDDTPLFSYRIHDDNVVAKESRISLDSIESTLKRWFCDGSRHELTDYAKEFYCNNKDIMNAEDAGFIRYLYESRTNIMKRFKVINSPLCIARNKRGLRSFRIRTLLGII